jgi:hypothetical protein
MRFRVKTVVLIILAIFLLPIAARAALNAFEERAATWNTADWSSTGALPVAAAEPEARVLVMSARINGWPPDARWFGDTPVVLADVKGAEAAALIPRIESAVRGYAYGHAGDYRIWPGPNSNTFVATVLRAVPELGVALLPNAVGKDFRPRPFVGLTDSRTGIEVSLWGVLGLKLGWVEGAEVNFLGLVAGLDVRNPALKLPGFGRIGMPMPVAEAAPAARS